MTNDKVIRSLLDAVHSISNAALELSEPQATSTPEIDRAYANALVTESEIINLREENEELKKRNEMLEKKFEETMDLYRQSQTELVGVKAFADELKKDVQMAFQGEKHAKETGVETGVQGTSENPS